MASIPTEALSRRLLACPSAPAPTDMHYALCLMPGFYTHANILHMPHRRYVLFSLPTLYLRNTIARLVVVISDLSSTLIDWLFFSDTKALTRSN